MVKIAVILFIAAMLPGEALAEGNYFLGTRTGLKHTGQVFEEGRYKEHNLFIVIGTGPTTDALRTISGWKSRTSYIQDLGSGAETFGEQLSRSASSVPDNFSKLGKSIVDLFIDPLNELRDFNLITPAMVVGKTAVNAVTIGWHSVMVVAEPAARFSFGTVALAGAPLLKPVTYTGVAIAYGGTALYGYGSSAAAGAVMTGATGAVLALDVVTIPVVAAYEAFQPDSVADAAIEEADDQVPAILSLTVTDSWGNTLQSF